MQMPLIKFKSVSCASQQQLLCQKWLHFAYIPFKERSRRKFACWVFASSLFNENMNPVQSELIGFFHSSLSIKLLCCRCGKTTICQIFAALTNQKLYSVNCHLHMETSDFLGGLRPVRQRSKDQVCLASIVVWIVWPWKQKVAIANDFSLLFPS